MFDADRDGAAGWAVYRWRSGYMLTDAYVAAGISLRVSIQDHMAAIQVGARLLLTPDHPTLQHTADT